MAKVLLVEDDNNLREIYEARLQAEGYDIVTAHDGEEALVVAKNETPDLIISDVMMPKISGFEMLDILRNTDGLKDVKVIMLTALGQSDDQQRADRLGADRYLVKSQVTLEDIVKVAQDLLADEGGVPPISADATPPDSAGPATSGTDPGVTPAPAADPVAPSEPSSQPAVSSATALPAPNMSQPPASLNAQSTDDEEASVESQIENFVQGATSEATPASNGEAHSSDIAAPSLAAAPPPGNPASAGSTQPVVIAPDSTSPAVAAADDKLITDALATFSENTDGTPAPLLPPSQQPAPADATPAPAIIVSPGLPSLEKPVAPSVTIDGISNPDKAMSDADAAPTVARKKVIEPLSTATDKPDLNALLAREEANEAKPDTVTVIVPAGPSPQAAPKAAGTVDPNSIAL